MAVQANLVTVAQAAAKSGYSVPNLTKLLREGKIPGRKYGHYWLLNAEAVEEYKRTNPRPGPKPRSFS